jgi:hypothetical protein
MHFIVTLLIAISLSPNVFSQTCFSNIYPRVLGGSSAATWLLFFDIDSRSNIAVGGQSQDCSVVSCTALPNPLLLYITKNGVIRWAK